MRSKTNEEVFEIARQHMDDEEILNSIQDWVKQDKTSFLVRIASSINSSLTDIADAIRNVIREQAERGAAVLLTTHDMWEADELSDRVALIILNKG